MTCKFQLNSTAIDVKFVSCFAGDRSMAVNGPSNGSMGLQRRVAPMQQTPFEPKPPINGPKATEDGQATGDSCIHSSWRLLKTRTIDTGTAYGVWQCVKCGRLKTEPIQ